MRVFVDGQKVFVIMIIYNVSAVNISKVMTYFFDFGSVEFSYLWGVIKILLIVIWSCGLKKNDLI